MHRIYLCLFYDCQILMHARQTPHVTQVQTRVLHKSYARNAILVEFNWARFQEDRRIITLLSIQEN